MVKRAFDLGVDVSGVGVRGRAGAASAASAPPWRGVVRMEPPGAAGRRGLWRLGADVGEFDEGGEAGAEGFGVFAGALDGFAYGLAAGVAVGG